MKPASLEGLPEDYNAPDLDTALQETVRQVNESIEGVEQKADLALAAQLGAAATPTPPFWPDFSNVRELTIKVRTGIYGGLDDPRLSLVSGFTGDGIKPPYQRFRFGHETILNPLFQAPNDEGRATEEGGGQGTYFDRTETSQVMTFGQFVTKIPHDLGRLPEFVFFRSSAGTRGPTGQRCTFIGGDGTFVDAGTNVRADIDFIPVFGLDQNDTERKLKFLFGFGDGTNTLSETSFDKTAGIDLGVSNAFESPELLRGLSAEMITTDTHFGGILVATTWGLGAWQDTVGSLLSQPPLYFITQDLIGSSTRDPVSGIEDSMAVCPLPELGGKTLYALKLKPPVDGLQAMHDNGVRLRMTAGTVDFIMG